MYVDYFFQRGIWMDGFSKICSLFPNKAQWSCERKWGTWLLIVKIKRAL